MSNQDDASALIGIVVVTTVFLGCCFAAYRVGHWQERKELTKYFVEMTTKTYDEAFMDGVAFVERENRKKSRT